MAFELPLAGITISDFKVTKMTQIEDRQPNAGCLTNHRTAITNYWYGSTISYMSPSRRFDCQLTDKSTCHRHTTRWNTAYSGQAVQLRKRRNSHVSSR
jgi:hypothetical protein